MHFPSSLPLAFLLFLLLYSGTSASLVEEVDFPSPPSLFDPTFSSPLTPYPLDVADIVDPFTSPLPSTFTSTSDDFDPFTAVALANPLISPSLHDFLVLGLTGGQSSTFIMSGAIHVQLQGAPTTFTDVYLTIHDDTTADGLYHGSVDMNITCGNGTLTWNVVPEMALLSGEYSIDNSSLTFISLDLQVDVAGLNEAMADFTFTPSSPAFYGNATCTYSITTANTTSPYVNTFLFEVLQTTTSPTPNALRVTFNLSTAPPLTDQYALYSQLAEDIATVLETDPDRIQVVSVSIDSTLNVTTVVIDFLPLPGQTLAGGARDDDSAAALVAAFVALTPAELAGTKWLHYADLSTVQQLCADGSYRALCTIAAPIAAVVATVAVTSSVAFIAGMTAVAVAIAAVAGGGVVLYRKVKRRRSVPHFYSPSMKASTEEVLAELHPNLSDILASPTTDVQALTDAIAVAIEDNAEHLPPLFLHQSSRASLSLYSSPSAPIVPVRPVRRSVKRSSRVQLSGANAVDGAERLERDLMEKMREAGGLREGRRFIYQPGVLLNDQRGQETITRRESFIQQMESGWGGERERGSIISSAYDSVDPLSTRSSFVSPSMRSGMGEYIPPIMAPKGHLHYVSGEDSDDDEDDSFDGDGPRFIDATADTTEVSPVITGDVAPGTAEVRVDISVDGGLSEKGGKGQKGQEGVRPVGVGRGSETKGRASMARGSARYGAGGMKGLEELHVGYEEGGASSHSRSPSISTLEVVNDWLQPDPEDIDTSTFHPLVSLDLPLSRPSPPPAPKQAPMKLDGKRQSWSTRGESKVGGAGKAQRIVLDLGKAGQSYGGSKGRGVGGGGEVKGWKGVGGIGAPLMAPLLTNASPHYRMSGIYQPRALY